jgi:hypothetical protein
MQKCSDIKVTEHRFRAPFYCVGYMPVVKVNNTLPGGFEYVIGLLVKNYALC